MLGRVNSVYALLGNGGAALGAVLGGLLASGIGLTGPFWIAFVSMALLTGLVWTRLSAVAQPS
jgi:predicted MFS family arabinose efflux permease